MKHLTIKNLLVVLLFIAFLPVIPSAQDASSLLGGAGGGENSLMNLLKTDMMRRVQEADQLRQKQSNLQNPQSPQSPSAPSMPSSGRPPRPRPEMGKRDTMNEPVDISKYLGPNGDSNKTMDKLRDMGKIPQPGDAPSPPDVTNADDKWKDVPLDKRIAYVDDLLKRRDNEAALKETDQLLNQKLDKDQLLKVLIQHEKALYQTKQYETVERDFFRLQAYYKDSKEVEELKKYLEDNAGITNLKNQVMQNPADPKQQYDLLNLYKQKHWLDFAEEFFIKTINDVSTPTIKSLDDVYYTKKDFDMMVKLAKTGQQLFPEKADFYYNEGVGLFNQKDPTSLKMAKDKFTQASTHSPSPELQKNINWYMDRLKNVKQ